MPTFIMLSNAASEQGSRFYPNPYQYHWLDELLGLTPGCQYDKDDTFNGQLWYAFTEILEGDGSQIKSVDLDPESWYSPESIINLDCEVVVDSYLQEQEPDWWSKMVTARGEPTKSYWGDYEFTASEDGKEVGSPCIYSLTPTQKSYISDQAKGEIIHKLRDDVVTVTDVEKDEDGSNWGKSHEGKLIELFYRSDDEEEWEMFEYFKQTNYKDHKGEPLYVERYHWY